MKQHWSAVVTAITSTFGGGDDDDDGCGGGVLDVQCKSMAPVSLLSLSLSFSVCALSAHQIGPLARHQFHWWLKIISSRSLRNGARDLANTATMGHPDRAPIGVTFYGHTTTAAAPMRSNRPLCSHSCLTQTQSFKPTTRITQLFRHRRRPFADNSCQPLQGYVLQLLCSLSRPGAQLTG